MLICPWRTSVRHGHNFCIFHLWRTLCFLHKSCTRNGWKFVDMNSAISERIPAKSKVQIVGRGHDLALQFMPWTWRGFSQKWHCSHPRISSCCGRNFCAKNRASTRDGGIQRYVHGVQMYTVDISALCTKWRDEFVKNLLKRIKKQK